MKSRLFASLLLAVVAAQGETDWARLNIAAREQAKTPIRALVRYNTADARAIARKMADWLIAHSQPADAPLAHFPPTYWGDRRDVAVKNAGQNMLLYPAHAALAYLDLADVLRRAGHGADSRKYQAAALDIARTYARLQRADGTIPTYFDSRKGCDWANCMIYVADRLEALADAIGE